MSWWAGKTVLITGGTGSFGNAFVDLILREPIAALRVFSRDEHKQEELERSIQDARVRYLLGDIRDERRLVRAMAGVEVLIHAAALKRVPALEYNIQEAVATNIIGSQNVVEAAIDREVTHAVLISTDKAVQPANVYGATKTVAEYVFLRAYSGKAGPVFSVARLGNMWDSRGAVVNLWRKQREAGWITLTDPDCTRFWISTREAAAFVKETIEREAGGVWWPAMPGVTAGDVATAVAPDAERRVIGLRSGEKLHEAITTAYTSDTAPRLTVREIRERMDREGEMPRRHTPSTQRAWDATRGD